MDEELTPLAQNLKKVFLKASAETSHIVGSAGFWEDMADIWDKEVGQ